MSSFDIEEWEETHPHWQELIRYIESEQLAYGVLDEQGRVPGAHLLVAVQAYQLMGFLMFLVQPIGPEMDCPILCDREGRALTEAKIRAFHVREEWRGQGIGTALQREVLHMAAAQGCYQVRSRSDFSRQANYAIKLKLGFVAHPAIRSLKGGEEPGIYWIKRISPGEK